MARGFKSKFLEKCLNNEKFEGFDYHIYKNSSSFIISINRDNANNSTLNLHYDRNSRKLKTVYSQNFKDGEFLVDTFVQNQYVKSSKEHRTRVLKLYKKDPLKHPTYNQEITTKEFVWKKNKNTKLNNLIGTEEMKFKSNKNQFQRTNDSYDAKLLEDMKHVNFTRAMNRNFSAYTQIE